MKETKILSTDERDNWLGISFLAIEMCGAKYMSFLPCLCNCGSRIGKIPAREKKFMF
jgi:hypothetical protein